MRELKYRVWGVDVNGEGECKMWFVPDIRDTDTSRRVLSELEDNDVMELNPWMQYTGLKDRHGVEIYEGDIVKGEYRTYVIEYYGAEFRLKTADDSSPDLLPVLENSSRIEVIGNIWENPELVEANQ